MKLLLSGLLLVSLRACSSWSVSSGTLVVTQTPDVSVMEGETVNITCCWTGGFERKTVKWLKTQASIKRVVFSLKDDSRGKETSDCSNLTFRNITREDSGRYTCRVSVEIPSLTMVEGKGTGITVTARENTKGNTDPPKVGGSHNEEVFIYVLRCLPIIALVTTFFYLNKLGAEAQQHTPAAPGNELTSAQRVEEEE